MGVYFSNVNDKMKVTNTTLDAINTKLGLLAISNAGDLNDPTTMARLVRAGLGEAAYPVGSQVTVTHSVYGDLVFDVAAHNWHKKTGDESAPTMTLLMHNTIDGISFDAAELLWANTIGWGQSLPAGTYHFTLRKSDYKYNSEKEDGTYQFTTTKAIPYYGGFRHTAVGKSQSTYSQANITGGTVTTYDASGNELESGLVVTLGDGGTNLGTTSRYQANIVNLVGTFNSSVRSQYGSDNWKNSDVRQWLNSSSAANKWWRRRTVFDLKSNFVDKDGFMAGLDTAFKMAIGKADVVSMTNLSFEMDQPLSSTYVTSDVFFIPSNGEIAGATGPGMETDVEKFPLIDRGITSVYKYAIGTTSPVATYWIRSGADNMGSGRFDESVPSCLSSCIYQYYMAMFYCNSLQTVCPACVIC
ncbi:MAG: DUF6273 domain-containing protein [Clostridia bacterium]|nr:DUF6273 domain-containing protein [Clostridia bacterium]